MRDFIRRFDFRVAALTFACGYIFLWIFTEGFKVFADVIFDSANETQDTYLYMLAIWDIGWAGIPAVVAFFYFRMRKGGFRSGALEGLMLGAFYFLSFGLMDGIWNWIRGIMSYLQDSSHYTTYTTTYLSSASDFLIAGLYLAMFVTIGALQQRDGI